VFKMRSRAVSGAPSLLAVAFTIQPITSLDSGLPDVNELVRRLIFPKERGIVL
jgi:hypothetical protein